MTSSDSNNVALERLAPAAHRALDILGAGEPAVGVAVSGGSDSTALLMLLADWGRANKVRIEAVTVDHGLRPEAKDEAGAIARIAADLGVSHTILTWDRQPSAKAVAQAEARDARHALLASWAKAQSIPVIALGHTRDDRIETFLMRARAGSGWRGLSGPLPSAPSPAWPEGRGLRLIRPLLAFGREELREALRMRNLSWIEDPSNTSMRFERVRMRELVSRMEGASLAQSLRVMDGLAEMRAASLAEARSALQSVALSEAEAGMPLEHFNAFGDQSLLRLIEALVMAAGGAAQPPRTEALGRIVQRVSTSNGSFGVTLAGAWLRTDSHVLRVSRAPPRQGSGQAADTPFAPAWDRAAALLGDPRCAALAVRGESPVIPEASADMTDGAKDAGK